MIILALEAAPGALQREKTVLLQDSPKTRVLIIPHQPNRDVKVRAVEMAKYLAGQNRYQIYALTWEPTHPISSSLPGKILHKTRELGRTCRTPLQITPDHESGIQWVTLPYMLAPYPICQWFNQNQLSRFVQEHRIQVVISGNAYHFPMPKTPSLIRIYDVVDDHLSPNSGPAWRRTQAFTLGELAKAQRITTISHALQDTLAATGFPHSVRIPNGVSLDAVQNVSTAEIQALRERYGLNKAGFSISYIGNHGWWAGMDLLLEAFRRLQERVPQCRLLIVGPGEELPRYRQQTAGNPDIIFTGPIPPQEIATYFHACNVGVLPFQQCPFTDNAMPLKILEYGAARTKMLATPLKELETLNFPHVSLLEADPESWAAALEQEALAPTLWQDAWDPVIAEYDWPFVLQTLDQLLENCHAPAV